jgi:hypothetical protein
MSHDALRFTFVYDYTVPLTTSGYVYFRTYCEIFINTENQINFLKSWKSPSVLATFFVPPHLALKITSEMKSRCCAALSFLNFLVNGRLM